MLCIDLIIIVRPEYFLRPTISVAVHSNFQQLNIIRYHKYQKFDNEVFLDNLETKEFK